MNFAKQALEKISGGNDFAVVFCVEQGGDSLMQEKQILTNLRIYFKWRVLNCQQGATGWGHVKPHGGLMPIGRRFCVVSLACGGISGRGEFPVFHPII